MHFRESFCLSERNRKNLKELQASPEMRSMVAPPLPPLSVSSCSALRQQPSGKAVLLSSGPGMASYRIAHKELMPLCTAYSVCGKWESFFTLFCSLQLAHQGNITRFYLFVKYKLERNQKDKSSPSTKHCKSLYLILNLYIRFGIWEKYAFAFHSKILTRCLFLLN